MIDNFTALIPNGILDMDKIDSEWSEGKNSKVRCYRNLKLVQQSNGVKTTGSLTKSLKGDNIQNATRDELYDFLLSIEDTLHLSLKNATVFVLEIGTTLQVDHVPSAYLRQWNDLDRYKMNTYKGSDKKIESVTYFIYERNFKGYDKGRQEKIKQHSLEGPFYLRLEFKILHFLKKFYGNSLNMWDLVKPDIYNRNIDLLKQFYFSIPKSPTHDFDLTYATNGSFKNMLEVDSIQTNGPDKLLAQIGELVAEGKLDRREATKMRNIIKSRMYENVSHVDDSLKKELDRKVMDFAEQQYC